MSAARFARGVVAALALVSAAATAAPLPHEIYIWQRVWTPALVSSLDRAAVFASGWRVLAAESDARGQLAVVAPDWRALDRSHREIVMVVRIDGRRPLGADAALDARIGALALVWRRHGVARLEIDYDCATAKLES